MIFNEVRGISKGLVLTAVGTALSMGCTERSASRARLSTSRASRAQSSTSRAQALTPQELNNHTIERRAIEAAIWGMPIVSVDAMREAFFRDARANYNDIVFWSKPANWKNQTTTPNVSSRYVYFNFNTKEGPVVLEVPPLAKAGLLGTLIDAWQAPLIDIGPEGEDQGKGGKYLLLPPDFTSEVPHGYISVRSETYNGFGLFRSIPKGSSEVDAANATALVKRMRLYPLARASKPPEQRFVDMADKLFDGIAAMDESFYTRLARMVNEEAVLPRDWETMNMLRSLGIEKGKQFKPDAQTRAVLKEAIGEAHAWFMDGVARSGERYWLGREWNTPVDAVTVKTGFTFVTDEFIDVDARGKLFFCGYGSTTKLGAASFAVKATSDGAGDPLRGEYSYRLHVPRDVPARQFWSMTLYDLETCSFIREMPRAGVNSSDAELQQNADGSLDIYFGPTPPAGQEPNWVATRLGRTWFALFRVYGPEKPLLDKTWKLPDIEKVK